MNILKNSICALFLLVTLIVGVSASPSFNYDSSSQRLIVNESSEEEPIENTENQVSNEEILRANIYEAADTEVTVYRSLNLTLNCEIDEDETTVNICDEQELEEFLQKIQEAIDLLDSSKASLERAFTATKELKDEGEISSLERNSILRKIKKAAKKDQKSIKLLKLLERFITKKLDQGKTLEAFKDSFRTQLVLAIILSDIQKAYEKFKVDTAKLMFDAELAEQEFLDDFTESIDDYEIVE